MSASTGGYGRTQTLVKKQLFDLAATNDKMREWLRTLEPFLEEPVVEEAVSNIAVALNQSDLITGYLTTILVGGT